jgi:hypothetical protein
MPEPEWASEEPAADTRSSGPSQWAQACETGENGQYLFFRNALTALMNADMLQAYGVYVPSYPLRR